MIVAKIKPEKFIFSISGFERDGADKHEPMAISKNIRGFKEKRLSKEMYPQVHKKALFWWESISLYCKVETMEIYVKHKKIGHGKRIG